MAELTLQNVKKSYGELSILHGIDLKIASGEFTVFVGPSGCGKSTLLRSIAGLEDITSGELRIDGQLMNKVPPSRRGIAMVFQSYALYPHMTVYENMAFGMRIAGEHKNRIDERVRQAAASLQLQDYLQRFPKALSGGQRQRVAIGRAIVRNPRVFLFDEPLSNLDAALRVATRIEIAKLKKAMPNATMIYVTHDQVEAMTLADRIVVLKDGKIEQIGSPTELYRKPGNLFVAQFIGSPAMNILPAIIDQTGTRTIVHHIADRKVQVPVTTDTQTRGCDVHFGIRPEDLFVAPGEEYVVEGLVDHVEQLGEVQLVYVKVGTEDRTIVAKLPGYAEIEIGSTLKLDAKPQDLHLFDQAGQSLLQ